MNNDVYLRQQVAKKIADTRSDENMSQADLEQEISAIVSRIGTLKILRDFVAANIAAYRIQFGHTLTTFSSSLEDVEKELRSLGVNSGASLDKSKLSKLEQMNGRTCNAEELYVIALALHRSIKSFFPPEIISLNEDELDPLEDYKIVNHQNGIREYQHYSNPGKIAVVFLGDGMQLPKRELAMSL